MRRTMLVLLTSLLLVSLLAAVTPAWAKGGRRGHGRGGFVVVQRDFVVLRPHTIRVLRPIIVDDVILIPHRDFRVIERDRDHILIIVGTRNVLIILRS